MDILETIKNSQNIVLTTPREMEGDIFCGALALFYTLNKLGKNVNLMLPHFLEKLKFLATREALDSLNQGNIIISINTQGDKIEKILYEKNSKELKFNLDLKNSKVKIENISFGIREGADVIINMDNNLIFDDKSLSPPRRFLHDSNSLTMCEKIIDFLNSADENLIDKKIATCLLAGLVYSTQDFQSEKTRPVFLEKAGYLIEKGADYQKIIQHLYKTRSLSEIKLLGKVLSVLKFDVRKNIAWASLNKEDFVEINSSSRDLSFVLEALKTNFSIPKTIFLLWEGDQSAIKGLFYSSDRNLIQIIARTFPSVARNNCVIFAAKDSKVESVKNKILNLLNI